MSELAYWAPLWVQAPFGARVLSFVCCAPNDGFSPQSGLVQRGVLYAAAAAGKPYNRPDGRGNAFPLWWLAPPPSTTSWWDYGYLAMEPCLCRKA